MDSVPTFQASRILRPRHRSARRRQRRERQHDHAEHVVDHRSRRHDRRSIASSAYGDSIYAGYHGSISSVARRARRRGSTASTCRRQWNTDIEVIRRTKSGAVASDIYNNKIVAERSYMQATNTRVVTFEMCGNDGLQARTSFAGQSGHVQLRAARHRARQLHDLPAAARCSTSTPTPTTATRKVVSNLYYPGYDADNALTSCTDPATGQKSTSRTVFLPYIARMNWRACNFANTYGFACADSFAQYMGADYDSNGDGQIDSEALRYVQGESESGLRDAHHQHAALDDPRRQHPLREREHQLRLHPVGRHAPDLHRLDGRRRPVRRHGLGLERAPTTPTPDRRRQEPGLEPARPRAHGLGAVGLQPAAP